MERNAEFWESRYSEGILPWDTGRADLHLTEYLLSLPRMPDRALEIGCGHGHNVFWMASRGITVVGVDISSLAIEGAVNLFRKSHPNLSDRIHFAVHDILENPAQEAPFTFAFDRGCFHTMEDNTERERFTHHLARSLQDGGVWLSILGSADDPPREMGPPRRSASEFIPAVEKHFEILSLRSGFFDTEQTRTPRGWILIARKR